MGKRIRGPKKKLNVRKMIEERASEFEELILDYKTRTQIAAYFGVSRTTLYMAVQDSETLKEIAERCDQMVLDDIVTRTKQYAIAPEKITLSKQKVLSDGSVIDYTEEATNGTLQAKALELIFKHLLQGKTDYSDATINILVNGKPINLLGGDDEQEGE